MALISRLLGSLLLLQLLLQLATAQTSCSSFPCASPANMGLPIPVVGQLSYTFTLSGLPTVLTGYLSLTTFIMHPYSGDLILTLTSPAGTVITLANRDGGIRANIFEGTTWSDAAAFPAVTYLVGSSPLSNFLLRPDVGSFSQFLGQNPNGVWTFTVKDVEVQDQGTLEGLVLSFTDAAGCPNEVYGNAVFLATQRGATGTGICQLPYSGTITRKCQSNGVWATSLGSYCVRNKCPAEDAGNAHWADTNAPYLAQGTCFSGFAGKPYRQCNSDGSWSDVINPCVIPGECPLEYFGNAQWNPTSPGVLATGICDDGYTGTTTRQCLAEGVWAPAIQYHCKKIPA
jgi:subtilisin-like proprotein convertase family protein